MKEEFLHYLWKYGLFDKDRLTDEDGTKIIVLDPGEYNRDSGPDFFNARIQIGSTIWAGNVEIHIKSSHFDVHGHNTDPAFSNIILHVVGQCDRKVFNHHGQEIPTVELEYDNSYYDNYLTLINNPFIIACQEEIKGIDSPLIRIWLDSLMLERMIDKTGHIISILRETGNDWEETFYRILSRYFGFRVNTAPFEMLAKALPFRIIRKHSDNIIQIEALLYGTAGLLDPGLFREELTDPYYKELLREFSVLSAKYTLQPMHGWLWKFSRLRPSNFPSIRISQLAHMLSVTGGLFSRIIDSSGVDQLRSLFEVSASEYWDDHFVFGKTSRSYKKTTGDQAADLILINAVIPVLFTYGQERNNILLKEKAIEYLDSIRPEDNSVIREWEQAGILSESAFFTQALLQLRNEYCRKRKCLNCRICNMIISRGKDLKEYNQLLLEP